MSIVAEFLGYPFLQRALLACLMVGILCPLIGVFVISRKMAFFSDAISHSAFAGIAAGILLGMDISFTSIAFAILLAMLIAYLSERTSLSHDTVIGVAFSGAMAVGIFLIGFMKGYRADLFSYLFGDILALTGRDIIILYSLGPGIIIILLLLSRPLLQITFNRELASVSGLPVRLLEYIMFFLIAIAVTVSLKIVGIILVTSMIIVPAASAKNIAESLNSFFFLSSLFGLISVTLGLSGSLFLNTPAGPTIILTSVLIFLLTTIKRRLVAT